MSDGTEQIRKMYKRQLEARTKLQTELFLNGGISLENYLKIITELKESYKDE